MKTFISGFCHSNIKYLSLLTCQAEHYKYMFYDQEYNITSELAGPITYACTRNNNTPQLL